MYTFMPSSTPGGGGGGTCIEFVTDDNCLSNNKKKTILGHMTDLNCNKFTCLACIFTPRAKENIINVPRLSWKRAEMPL